MAVGIISQAVQPSQSSVQHKAALKPEQFDDLVIALKDALGPSSGLDSADVDLNTLMRYMRIYDANEKGWVPYAMADPELAYTRNLVDEGNGKSNLVSNHLPDHEAMFQPRVRPSLTMWPCQNSLCLCGPQARAALSTTTATPTAS